MKKVMLFVLSLCILLSCVCVSVAEEAPKITMLMYGSTTPREGNKVLEEIKAKTGVDLEITVVPAADYDMKLSALIASDSLPDIFQFKPVEGFELSENGILLDITALLNEYGQDILNDRGDFMYRAFNTKEHIYGIPWGSFTSSHVFQVRKDWLDNLGLEMPTDLDSLYNVLSAFTHDDPDKNGKDDTYGIGFCMELQERYAGIFAAYGIPFDRNVELEDGTVTTYFRHPDYLKAVEYLNKLYHDGLMEQEYATIPTMSLLEKLWSDQFGVWYGNATATLDNWLGRYVNGVPDWQYTTIAGPEGKYGSVELQFTGYYGISSKCANPEAAIKLANYLTSTEGETLLYLGVEGYHYNWTNEEKTAREFIGDFADSAVNRNDGVYAYFTPFQKFDVKNSIVYRLASDIVREGMQFGLDIALKDATVYEVTEAEKEYGASWKNVEKEALAKLIACDPAEIEAVYQQYVNEWLAEGGEEYEAQVTELYHK